MTQETIRLTDPSRRPGTVAGVNSAHPSDPPVDMSVLGRMLDAATAMVDLIDGAPDIVRALGERGDVVNGETTDLIGSLTGLAWFQQHQLALVVSLLGRVQDSSSTVDDLMGRARGLGTASASAIGAAASLLGATREGDEVAIASVLADATAAFDDGELIAGSLALTASLSMVVADALDLDVAVAHRDMIAVVTRRDEVTSSHQSPRADLARSVARGFERSTNRQARALCRRTMLAQRIDNIR